MPPNTIVSTAFLLPTTVVANGQVTGNGFTNPNNILLVDGDVASSNPNGGVASDITIGNFNTNLPQNAVIVGIELQLIAYRGSQTVPPITVTPYLYDDNDGANNYYPYVTPFTGLTTTIGTYTLGTPTYLFASSFSVDQINNMKMNIVVNGDVSIDSFLVKVYYYEQTSGTPVTPVVGTCTDCDSVIQVPEMYLALPFLINQTKFYLQAGSFTYADGTPVQPGDVGGCGGEVNFVFDEGKRKIAGQNFEENAIVDVSTGTWTVLSSGIIEVDIFAVTNRGLEPKTPYGHDANLMSDHDANSKVVISNSGRFYKRFVRQCEADVTFSRPIDVEKDEADVVNPIHTLNFKGNGVTVQQNGTDPFQADVTIQGSGTGTPSLDSVSSSTSGSTQVLTDTWSHTCLGTDRLLVVQISMESGKTVTALTYNSVPMTFEVADELNGTRVEIWSLVAPTVGTNDIDVTFSAVSYYSGGAESFTGIDQSTPIGTTTSATGTDQTPTVLVNTLYDNSIIVDGLSTALTPILLTPGAGQIENWSHYANTDTRQGASSLEVAGTAPDAVTMDYTITQNTDWTICAIEIKGLTTTVANLVIEDEGVVIDSSVSNMDFVGAGVAVTQTAPGQVQVTIPGGAATDELVKVSAADTTAGYLQPKLNIHSSDGSVTVTETITNPAGNEVLDIDLTGFSGMGGGGTKIIVDPTYVSIASTGFSTVYSETIPAGTLGTDNAIRFEILTSELSIEPGDTFFIRASYGGTVVATASITGSNNGAATIGGMIIANAATNAQKGFISINTDDAGNAIGYGTSSADSTTSQILLIEARSDDTGANYIEAEGIVVEKITSGGSPSEKKVGVGEISDINWFNIQYPFTGDYTTTSAYDIWDLTNATAGSPSHINLGAGEYVTPNSSDYSAFFPDFSNGDYAFNSTKQIIAQITAQVSTPANENCGIGFDVFGALAANKIFAQVGTNDVGIGFVRDNAGVWYARSGDGAGFTETPITVNDGTRVFRIEYDPGNATPQARFYVDGVLLATVTTNLPTAVASVVAFTAGNDGGCTTIGTMTAPSFAVEI